MFFSSLTRAGLLVLLALLLFGVCGCGSDTADGGDVPYDGNVGAKEVADGNDGGEEADGNSGSDEPDSADEGSDPPDA